MYVLACVKTLGKYVYVDQIQETEEYNSLVPFAFVGNWTRPLIRKYELIERAGERGGKEGIG